VRRTENHESEGDPMREALDAWTFVAAAYAVGIGATLAMTLWSLLSMQRAEKRRDDARKR